MLSALVISALLASAASYIIHRFGIALAHRFKLLDIPSPRRKHQQPTAIIGGMCIFSAWTVGLIAFCIQQPEWFHQNSRSILALGSSLAILIVLGLIDDISGLKPAPKLVFQFIAASIVLAFEPQLHAVCIVWQSTLGYFVWPLCLLWIVAITNSINLIDGLDGLAAGTSLLASISVLILSVWSNALASLSMVVVGILIPAISVFLKFNWAPARIFLGDNGSLPLGFVIASMSLICRPTHCSWIMIASVVLMLGYPILDMGLAVWRRYRSGLELFKADRNHLHFRIQRLGLSTAQTAFLLLSIGLYLQCTALCVNLLPPAAAALGMCLVAFSIFTLLFVIKCVELEMIRNLVPAAQSIERRRTCREELILNIELGPLYEVALLEEKGRYHGIVDSLEMMLKAIAAKNEEIIRCDRHISVVLSDPQTTASDQAAIKSRYKAKIDNFCSLLDLQCSLSSFPVSIERRKAS